MLKKLIKIISSKKDFLPPRKTNILVIDDNFKKIVDVYFNKKKVSFLDIRYKRFNIFVLLKLFFSKKKNLFFNYVVEYIHHTNCRYIITFNDNLPWFYQLKKIYPDIKMISIQNGFRTRMFFGGLKNLKDLSSNYICVFNKKIGDKFSKNIKAEIILIGSVINNFKKKINKNKRKSVLFISSGYPRTEFFESWNKKDYKIPSNTFYNNDILLLKNLASFCKRTNMQLEIAGKFGENNKELNYFKNKLKKIKFVYHKCTRESMKTYEISDEVLATVCVHSTFGPESLARGNRTAIFNNKKKTSKGKWDIFWYLGLKSKGPFWSDKINKNEVNRVLNFVVQSKEKEWNLKTKKVIKDLMEYDPNNKKLMQIIKKLK